MTRPDTTAERAPARPELRGARVLLVGNWPPPPGGVSVHLEALRSAATKAGATVHVLDIGRGHNSGDRLVPARGAWPFGRALARLLASTRFDLVHVHTNGANRKSWALVAGTGSVARGFGVRSLVTFHSGHGPRWLVTRGRRLAARLSLGPYARIVCVSSEILLALTWAGIEPARMLQAPAFGREGVVPGMLPEAVRDFAEAHPLLVVSMLGPEPEYGQRHLLEAFAAIERKRSDVGLVVCGPGTDARGHRRLVRSLALEHVRLLGPLDRASGLAVLAASRVFVRPTLVDGDAVSVREALALGVGVIATRVGTRPEGVELVPPADPDALAEAIGRAIRASDAPSTPVVAMDGIERVLALYGEELGRISARA